MTVAAGTVDAKDVIRQGLALHEEDRVLEAVELLTEFNREHRDPEIERLLVRWRHDAFAFVDRTGGLPSWPREMPDPFPEVDGVPEVDVSELTPDVVGGAIVNHGCLKVRGLVDPQRVGVLIDDIDRAFDAFDAWKDGAALADTIPWCVPFKPGPDYNVGAARQWVRQGGGVWTVDSPRAMFDLIETFEMAGLGDVLTGYLGERPCLSVKKCTLRRVPVDTGTDWHQDGSFLGEGIRTVNVWLALTDCGVDAPALDLVPRRMPGIVETGSHGAMFDWSVGPGMVEIVADGAPVLRPEFAAGDALLFDERFLHRTGVSPGMTRERYAVESWFFAPSKYPVDQVPVVF
jgi:hypothetical protein